MKLAIAVISAHVKAQLFVLKESECALLATMTRPRQWLHMRTEMSQILKMTRFETLDLIVAVDRERVEANGTE